MKKLRITVGMSGGVDSSVSAWLLKQQGHCVEGLFMKNWEEDDTDDYCSAAADLKDAQAVCDTLNIPLHRINFSNEYWEEVFEHFLAEINAGRTPNPDILCNQYIKFKAFLDYALQLGADKIATGHYAQVDCQDGLYRLKKAQDMSKDQTYFLHTLTQAQLKAAVFPVGHLLKTEVREYAKNAGLITHQKKDSTGICFIGERRFNDFLSRYLKGIPGDIVTPEGQVLGRHRGLIYYTLGQRQGIGIGGRQDGEGTPWYVAQKDMRTHRLVVVQGAHHPLLFHDSLSASGLHWVHKAPPINHPLTAKIRYRQTDQVCTITHLNPSLVQVKFADPQRAITPGQSVVFYEGDVCLGGGTINNLETTRPLSTCESMISSIS